jgi:hypothetical protein
MPESELNKMSSTVIIEYDVNDKPEAHAIRVVTTEPEELVFCGTCQDLSRVSNGLITVCIDHERRIYV